MCFTCLICVCFSVYTPQLFVIITSDQFSTSLYQRCSWIRRDLWCNLLKYLSCSCDFKVWFNGLQPIGNYDTIEEDKNQLWRRDNSEARGPGQQREKDRQNDRVINRLFSHSLSIINSRSLSTFHSFCWLKPGCCHTHSTAGSRDYLLLHAPTDGGTEVSMGTASQVHPSSYRDLQQRLFRRAKTTDVTNVTHWFFSGGKCCCS